MDDLPALPILEAPSRPNSPSLTHIYDLPEELIVEEILSRLDSVDLARIRCVSNTPFYDFPTEFRSINLLCNLDRYTNSGRPITPFKIFATDLILTKGGVNSISISVEERANHKSIDIKLDDLYLTEVSFVYRWLRRVRRRLTSLSISDYPMHSRRKWSEVLSLISFHCTNLHELVLKNAWLSTKGMSSAMFKLTSLTLACVRLDDEDLDKVNSCCPSLRILKLILVEGLKEPRIDLLHLRTCQYVGSSFETTARLQLIHAPNLTRIKVGFGQRIAIIRWGLALGSVDLSGPLDVTSALTYRTYKTKLIMPLTFYLEKQLSFSRDKKISGKTLVSMYDQLVEIFFRRRYFPDFLLPKRWRTSSTDIKLLTKPYLKRKPTSSSSPTPSPTP